jgi:hypothetical protein
MNQTKVHEADANRKGRLARQWQQESARPAKGGAVQVVAPQVAYRRTQANSSEFTPANLLALQREVGNRQVQCMIAQRSKACAGGVVYRSTSYGTPVGLLQRNNAPSGRPNAQDPLTAPLTDREWRLVDTWLSLGEVGSDPLTEDAEHNADLVASAIFCGRALSHLITSQGEDPLLCLDNDVTRADPRVQRLRQQVVARGPIIHWPAVPVADRLTYVMNLLVNTHGYPANGAAGIVGNLLAESGVLPSRVEGSAAATPMRAANRAGAMTDFSPDEIMNRSRTTGPRKPGVGLAQWTTPARRAGLFQRTSGGRQLGSSILFNMDAQVEYLVSELQSNTGLDASLRAGSVTVNTASDNVVYQFEIPGSILNAARKKRPRTDPAVQAVFAVRRANSQRALQAYRAAQVAQAAPAH